MKALIIIGASIRICPYAHLYINELLLAGYEVTAVVWIRDGKPDVEIDNRVKIVHYEKMMDDATPKYKKLVGFLGFRNLIVKELNKKYDFVVALDTQFAVLVSDKLLRNYKQKFVYDMRDLSYESIGIYRKRVEAVIEAASAVFISSDGYRQFLPESNKIFTTHNLKIEDLEYEGIRNRLPRENTPLRLSFWGMVRDVQLNKAIIDILGRDNRFEINYYGALNELSQGLIEYCKESGYGNVHFYGQYNPHERYEFAKKTELIHNMYSNANEKGNPAMGNKYYDGVVFQIPQVCISKGYMAERVADRRIGIAVTVDKNLGDIIYEYYRTISWEEFRAACGVEKQDIIREYNIAKSVLKAVTKGENISEYIVK